MLKLAALVPVVSWVLLNATTAVLLTVSLRHRFYFFPAILIPAAISFKTIQYLDFPSGLSELWGMITCIGFIHFSSLLYLKRWTLGSTQQTTGTSRNAEIQVERKSWVRMYQVATNPRFVRVPYKDISFEQDTGSQVKSTAVHQKFSMKRVLWLLVKIGIHYLSNRFATTRLPGRISLNDFTPVKTILLRRLFLSMFHDSASLISKRDILVRIWFTVNATWIPILLLDSVHTALAMFFIHVICVDIPDDWPDLFGSPLEAFTLSRFWSRFWHRVHLSAFNDYAKLLIELLPPSFVSSAAIRRIIMTFLLFLTSGLVHHYTNTQLNPKCADYADIQFFCLNAAIVVLESALLRLRCSRQHAGKDKEHEVAGRSVRGWLHVALVRLLGYLWVSSIFIWAVPKLYYPRVYCTITELHSRRTVA